MRHGRGSALVGSLAALMFPALLPASAGAVFHLMKVREVSSGSGPNSGYVELH